MLWSPRLSGDRRAIPAWLTLIGGALAICILLWRRADQFPLSVALPLGDLPYAGLAAALPLGNLPYAAVMIYGTRRIGDNCPLENEFDSKE